MSLLERLFAPYVRALHVHTEWVCPVTRCRLDVRTAIIIEDRDGRVLYAMSPEGFAARGQDVLRYLPVDAHIVSTLEAPHMKEVA